MSKSGNKPTPARPRRPTAEFGAFADLVLDAPLDPRDLPPRVPARVFQRRRRPNETPRPPLTGDASVPLLPLACPPRLPPTLSAWRVLRNLIRWTFKEISAR